jgi:Cu(I)/Ag(I) efflux system membrane fusion protein
LALALIAAGCSRAPSPERRVLYYYDPMHPAYRSDRPGIAPDCNMQLVAKYAGEPAADRSIHLNTSEERAAGIETVEAAEQTGAREILAPGHVSAAESSRYKVSVGADGWIRQVFAGETGSIVRKGQPLATYISREVSTPQQGYFYALDAVERAQKAPGHTADQLSQATRQLDLARDTLAQLGMDETQIVELARTRTENRELILTAPAGGVVTLRNAAPGERFSKGQDLFEIASIDSVWIEASVFPADAGAIGGLASAVAVAPDGTRIQARRLSSVAQFDTTGVDSGGVASRIRLEAANPAKRLLPGMYVTVLFEITMPRGLAVPADSVVDSGSGAHVFVRRSDGAFELRRVVTGWRADGLVQVLKGLKPGESAARSGVFLLDSETRIRGGDILQ